MNDQDKEAMLQELLDLVHIPTRDDFPQPNILVSEYVERKGVNRAEAYNALERAYHEGKLSKGHVMVDGHKCCLYWMANSG